MINPFYWLEIRIRASEKRLWIIALFFLLSILLIGGGIIAVAAIDSTSVIMGELGQAIMYTLLFLHGVMLVVMAPLASAGRIAQEREQRTLPALINTNVSRYKIVRGKLFAAWTFILWLSSLVLPFIGIGVLWGGISYWKIAAFFGINVVISMIIASIALGFSGLLRRSLSSYLMTGVFLMAWMIVLPILGGIGSSMCSVMNWPGVNNVLMYICFYSNPFFPSIALATGGMDMELWEILPKLIYCFVVWGILAFFGVFVAYKGLKKEVY